MATNESSSTTKYVNVLLTIVLPFYHNSTLDLMSVHANELVGDIDFLCSIKSALLGDEEKNTSNFITADCGSSSSDAEVICTTCCECY